MNGGNGSKYTSGQKLMISDLVKLLTRKEFDTFLSMTNGISDKPDQFIEKDGYFMADHKNNTDDTTNYRNAAYVVFMTYRNADKLLTAIQSKFKECGYTFINRHEETYDGIVDDLWLTFRKDANSGSGDTSLYAVNIFLTNTNEEHPSDPTFSVLRYVSSNAVSKNLTRKELVKAIDENGDAATDVCDIVVDGITGKLRRRDIKNPEDHAGLQACYYVDLPLMSISKEDIKQIFRIFDKLSEQPDIACSQQATP